MDAWQQGAGLIAAALSAAALYAGSPHCRWPRLRGRPRLARAGGAALAVLSAITWNHALGAAAGLCAMLAGWMLALLLQPWLAAWFQAPCPDGGPRAHGHSTTDPVLREPR